MKKLINKYNEIIMYGIFGVLTTIINLLIFYILDRLGVNVYLNNSIAWIISVLFAFITNKLYVFNSKDTSYEIIIKEGFAFFLARIFSYFVDMFTIFMIFQVMGINKIIAKIISNIIVIIINYLLSKIIIFKKK